MAVRKNPLDQCRIFNAGEHLQAPAATGDGAKIITLFPAEDLPIANPY